MCKHTHTHAYIYRYMCLYVNIYTHTNMCVYIYIHRHMHIKKHIKCERKHIAGQHLCMPSKRTFRWARKASVFFSNVRKPNDSITSQEQICWDKITSRKSTKSIISASSKWKKAHVVGNGLCLACKRLSNKTFVNHLHGTLLQHTPAGQTLLWHNLETLL